MVSFFKNLNGVRPVLAKDHFLPVQCYGTSYFVNIYDLFNMLPKLNFT